jgi:hypothetical protein
LPKRLKGSRLFLKKNSKLEVVINRITYDISLMSIGGVAICSQTGKTLTHGKNTFEIKPKVFHTKVISKEDGKIMDFVSFSMHFYMKRFSSVPQAKIYLKKFSFIVNN